MSLFLYALSPLILSILLFLVAPFLLIPHKRFRYVLRQRFFQKIPEWFAKLNLVISKISTRDKWTVLGSGELKKEGWYLMIANHQSWIDIIVLSNVFYQKIPALKFFMKKELLWQLPIAGLSCYILDYPFMARHSPADIKKNPALKGKDIETTKKACAVLREFPATFINFLEGTRFTQAKKARQDSPYHYLLKPRAGGAAVVLHELRDLLSGIINVTICYQDKTPSMWDFACGNFKEIIVRYEVLPITSDLIGDYHEDRNFRAHIQQYFNSVWQNNDAYLKRKS